MLSEKLVKVMLVALLIMLIVAAIFNLRLGFGAQMVDCIDSHVNITRLETPSKIDKGDLVVFVAPNVMSSHFAGHLIIKKVGAVAGDRIKVEKGVLFINDVAVGKLDVADRAAKLMNVPADSFERSETVPPGHIFMIGTKPMTFDSRYWGMLPINAVVGSAYPLI